MTAADPRSTSRYFRHHLVLLTLVLVVLALVFYSSQRRMAPEQLNPWVATGCDLSQAACQFLPGNKQQVVVAGDLETLDTQVWGRFEVAVRGRAVDRVSLQVICMDQSMQHKLIPMQLEAEETWRAHSQLPGCQPGTRERQVRVVLEADKGHPLAVSFRLTG